MSASDRVIEAARAVIEGKTSTFKAGNRRDVGIEMEDGEKGYIVHSDLIAHLEGAVAEYDKQKAAFKAAATR
jgi:hypothetical protein